MDFKFVMLLAAVCVLFALVGGIVLIIVFGKMRDRAWLMRGVCLFAGAVLAGLAMALSQDGVDGFGINWTPICWLASGWALVELCLGGCLKIIGGRRNRPGATISGNRWLAAGMVTILLLALFRIFVLPYCLNIQARAIVALPRAAKIVSVYWPCSGDGTGDVTFQLPRSKPVNEWMGIIWYGGAKGRPIEGTVKSKFSWTGDEGNGPLSYSLTYDPVSQEYRCYSFCS